MKLREVGVSAACYHNDMERDERAQTHIFCCDGQPGVVVATIEFGLYIDKHHTSLAIQATTAKRIAGYFQKSGRGERDGWRQRNVALQRAKDFTRPSSFVASSGSERVKDFYEIHRNSTGRETNSYETFFSRRAMNAALFGEVSAKQEADDDGWSGVAGQCHTDYCVRDTGEMPKTEAFGVYMILEATG